MKTATEIIAELERRAAEMRRAQEEKVAYALDKVATWAKGENPKAEPR